MYDPIQIKIENDRLAHGKPRLAGIRNAIAEADKNNDIPFMIYYRADMCNESTFYDDRMDLFIIFPELLAIIDEYPDAGVTVFNSQFRNSMEHVVWVYKWVIVSSVRFYQISLADCFKYFEDYKKRVLAMGYNLRNYYSVLCDFYKYIDETRSIQYFNEYMKLPRDGSSNCAACDRNDEIAFYLDQGDIVKAKQLAEDIESFKLTCGEMKDKSAWFSLKTKYIEYYLAQKDYIWAEECGTILERNINERTDYQYWDKLLYCYAHTDMGKALTIYKKHWMDWLNWREPMQAFEMNWNICGFLKLMLEAEGNNEMLKLPYNKKFPLFRKDQQYRILDIYRYYYEKANDVGAKFDCRNGTDYFNKRMALLSI